MSFRICTLALAALPLLAQDKLALDGIAHVAFRVADLQVSREFYRKLGFEQAFEFSDAAGTTVSYMKVNERQFLELYRRTDNAQPLGLIHLCFDTRDMDGLHSEYVMRGLKPKDSQKARAGNMLFTMLDPEGQLLEYTQYMPGSLHSNGRGQFLGERRVSIRLVRSATLVNDLAAEQTYFAEKLGFTVLKEGRLRIPGSKEEVDLEAASGTARPRIVFAVTDLKRTAADLLSRGIEARVSATAVTASDPDGAILEFVVVP